MIEENWSALLRQQIRLNLHSCYRSGGTEEVMNYIDSLPVGLIGVSDRDVYRDEIKRWLDERYGPAKKGEQRK